MPLPRLALAALLLTAPAGARALDCSAPQTQSDMTQCAALMYQAADADLNLAYGLARGMARQLDAAGGANAPGAERRLRDAQRAWIAFRDLACETESLLAYGGSMQPMLRLSCLERLTRARTEDLRYFGEVN
ncbi:MAG: lysozyme inhibitor LprI family protein [Antarcticimicrobium sp.]|uniref:lysozyme inhibitor LprI family protein n=1 Tax=Antarcticimicrobium sp. TaxID=2824147 RepID=UPI00261A8F04|nr:lysozyme inhibitor LprI family protein [Antarcticimicrobium sp.]MDF1715341.1 lysozyme inhibitor LprI family protein [Antarcticimicrobium sp.]